jgi:thiamine-monophosphate kinase
MTVGRLGERAVVQRILRRFSALERGHPTLIRGPGDDAAVLSPPVGRQWVLTADLLLDNIHFRREWSPPRLLGHKALAVNLSDLAAMGAAPEVFLLNLGLPRAWPLRSLDAFLDGMAELAARCDIALAGGDTCAADSLQIAITALGLVPAGGALSRSGGRPGDVLALTGSLGASRAGLLLLQAGWRLEDDATPRPPASEPAASLDPRSAARVMAAHLAPEPHLQAATLAGLATAGLDVSDGLSQDLHNLCEASRCGAEIFWEKIPVDPQAREVFRLLEREPVEEALAGGEDYCLLLALPEGAGDLLASGDAMEVGRLTAPAEGVCLQRPDGRQHLERRGFEHFPTS